MKRRETVVALLVAVAVVVFGGFGASALRAADRNRARADAAVDLAYAVASVEADVTALVNESRRLAASAGARGGLGGGAAISSPGAAGVSFALAGTGGLTVDGGGGLDARSLEPAAAVLELARDSATPRVTPPLALPGGGTRAFLVVPAFRPSADGTPASISTTDARRTALVGYVLVAIDGDALAARAQRAGSAVSITRAGATVGGARGETGSGRELVAVDVTVAVDTWTIEEVTPSVPLLPFAGWLLLIGAVVVAIAIVVYGRVTHRRRAAAADAMDAAAARVQLVRWLAPVMQQTADLGQVLPEVGARLRDELGLVGVGFAVPDVAGELRDVFALGSTDGAGSPADSVTALDAGEAASLGLHRGGRLTGVLRVKAGRPLTSDEVEALGLVAELTTSAIVSADLFEQQEEALRRLREVDALKTSFLSTASHELRTPVTAIIGFASLLDQGGDDLPTEQRRMFSSRIVANARALDSLVQDLLDFSRVERGRLVVAGERIDLVETTRSILERLTVLFSEHELVEDLQPAPAVIADGESLERILNNLVSNAVRYAPAGTTVTVRTAAAFGGAELVVDDQGPGVPAAERSRVFSRFFRGSGEAIVKTRGTGIGLAIVKEYAEQMGGTATVASAPGGGARFRIWLPAAPAEEGAAP